MKKENQNKEKLIQLILSNKEKITDFGTSRLGLFGSFVRNEQNDTSDVDIVVEFLPGRKTYDNFINLVYFLENLFGRKVELLTPESISPYLRHYIEREIEYVSFAS
jgi:hypothetical protein